MKNGMKCWGCMILMVVVLTACKNGNPVESVTNSTADTTQTVVEDIKTPEKGIDLEGIYNQNDLLITTLEEKQEDIILEIPQIEGLKDVKVQDKINKDIYERIETACQEYTKLEYVTYNTMGNFANVISVGVYIGGENESYCQIYMNYNLINGERLTLEDLFLENADILEIVRVAFREMLILNGMQMDGELQGSYDENELYRIVKNYSKSGEKQFAFTPSYILFSYKDSIASVDMVEIADQVGIYSKYITENSLFENDDVGRKGILTCVNVPEDAFDVWKFGQLEDNLWYDITAYRDYSEEELQGTDLEHYKAFKENIYQEIYEQLESYQKLAQENPEYFYIFMAKPIIYLDAQSEWVEDTWVHHYTGVATASQNIQVLKMPKVTYDEIYKEKLREAYRYEYLVMQGGIYFEELGEEVIVEDITGESTYNYMTDEWITLE